MKAHTSMTGRPESKTVNVGSRALILVGVSALALAASPYRMAYAQTVDVNCPQRLRLGQHIACGNGSLRINPDGSTNLSGCLVQQTAPQAGSCRLVITGGVGTRNVKVSFNAPSFTAKMGGDTVVINKLRMQERGQPTTANFFVFTPLALTNSITLDIGGTMSFSGGQPAGSYSGDIVINANFI